ncbi:hypothetical protein AAFF_G00011780 [Aldrovandia affinis]|uniref:Uncharacterized protein n=1 Tax=Aldrovandia affinis TaxID=143900 RepID=A0AAD7WHJ3_9TELE|nr:hypothetical protein AAFF_G00011780 [Aldrovandia affinis]
MNKQSQRLLLLRHREGCQVYPLDVPSITRRPLDSALEGEASYWDRGADELMTAARRLQSTGGAEGCSPSAVSDGMQMGSAALSPPAESRLLRCFGNGQAALSPTCPQRPGLSDLGPHRKDVSR